MRLLELVQLLAHTQSTLLARQHDLEAIKVGGRSTLGRTVDALDRRQVGKLVSDALKQNPITISMSVLCGVQLRCC